MKIKKLHSLRHCFLIATPTLKGGYFANTVTYICEHNEKGAFGLVITRPTDIKFGAVLDDLGIKCHDKLIRSRLVLEGGPVQRQQGVVIFRSDEHQKVDFYPGEGVAVSCSQTFLNEICNGTGPKNYQVCFGYAGWRAGQLERELRDNGWLVAPYNEQLIFDTPYEKRWRLAAASIGIDFAYLSPTMGRA